MPYKEIKIRYDVGHNKVIDRETGKTIPDVAWIDEQSKEYGQLSVSGDVLVCSGDVMLTSTRCGDRRKRAVSRQERRKPRDRRD